MLEAKEVKHRDGLGQEQHGLRDSVLWHCLERYAKTKAQENISRTSEFLGLAARFRCSGGTFVGSTVQALEAL